ncbi:MAG: LysM peptidoglycan-binding domain-containing protein [Intrasporangium sp.]|uniref:CIS tube protein n=1 Tax=Intrasporangium sp. TaxID=1925024 RepID=UPI0026493940|nr:LysM peptidoglycan-binding domain-containing protein [Intrasporangium sp.]MDN5797990.1 LysM peptidoglycan-binding domain-containing protein [Intrasporangium sp.]
MAGASVAMDVAAAGGGASAANSRPKLEHAYLLVHEPSPDGSLSKPGAQIDKISFQFNPKELSIAKAARWIRATGQGNEKSGPPQFQGPEPSKLSLEMFLDASDTQGTTVVKTVERLMACCVPTAASHDRDKGSPPWVLFRWGGLTGFLAYVSSVAVRYTLFTPGGLPIRATCTVSLEELAGETPRQNPTSGGLVPRRVHVVVEGDTLAALAYQEYGSPSLWRAVAHVNGIDDPMRLVPGTSLLMPSVEDLTELNTPEPAGSGIEPGTASPAGSVVRGAQ